MPLTKTYKDEGGYLRFNDTDKLVHRWVAYKKIYKPNKHKFDLPFSHYQIHHKDGNKFNNSMDNLAVVTEAEHYQHHKPIISLLKNLFGFKSAWGFKR